MANHKKQASGVNNGVNNFSAYLCMEDARVWARWNYSLVMHLNYPGPVSRFFLILNPQGTPLGGCCS